MRLHALLFSLSTIVLCVFLFPQSVQALGVSPSIVDGLTVSPGNRIQFEFRVLNDSNREKKITFQTQNFRADDGEEGGQEFIDDALPPASDLAGWIQVATENDTVISGGEMSAYAIVTVPANADPGGHYAVIWVSEQSPGQGTGNVSISSNVGLLVLINVDGDVVEDAEIIEFSVNKKSASFLPIAFQTRVVNKGSVYFQPKGEIRITNMLGQQVATLPVNPYQANVLPGSIRRLDGAIWSAGEPQEGAGFFTNLKREWQSKSLGKYTAGVYLMYPDGDVKSAEPQSFWIIPWRILLLSALSLFVFVVLIKGYNKLIISHAKKRLS